MFESLARLPLTLRFGGCKSRRSRPSGACGTGPPLRQVRFPGNQEFLGKPIREVSRGDD